MTLNEFIAKASAFFDKAERAVQDEAQAKITELEGGLANAGKTIEARDATIKELTGNLEKAQSEANAKTAEAKTLQSQVEAEKKRVDETLAAMGISPAQIPAAPPSAPSSDVPDVIKRFDAITDPKERSTFWNQHRKDIMSAWSRRK